MRYIRTKDGRIAEIKENMVVKVCDDATRLVYKEKPHICVLNGDDDILKQGDTIEELCDVIVCRNELFYPLTSNREGNEFDWEEIDRFRKTIIMSEEEYNKIKETSNDFEPYFWKAYGAIWTNKGLIYVAKMNERGVIELL